MKLPSRISETHDASHSTQHAESIHKKLEKCLADDDLIAVVERMLAARQQAMTAIDKCPVGAAEIFDEELAALRDDARVSARNFSFRIILIEIHVRENSAIGIPTANQRFDIREWKFLADLCRLSGSRVWRAIRRDCRPPPRIELVCWLTITV